MSDNHNDVVDAEQLTSSCMFCSSRDWGWPEAARERVFHSSCQSCRVAEARYPTMLCGFCRHLRPRHIFYCEADLSFDYFFWNPNIRSLGDLRELSLDCELCRFFYDSITRQSHVHPLPGDSTVEEIENSPITLCRRSKVSGWKEYFDWSIRPMSTLPRMSIDGIFKVQPRAQSSQCTTLSPFVDWDSIRSWISTEHLNDCGSLEDHSPLSPSVAGFRLIDTTRMCVRRALARCSYVTLSYVWGESFRNFRPVTGENVADLETPEGFSAITLPETVSDAIEACKKLHYRYIWIDCLCVPRGSENEHEQVNQMDRIYDAADLCLVAAAGSDAGYGLPGVSQPRMWKQTVGNMFDMELRAYLGSAQGFVERSEWQRRAWVYQEFLFSRRLLFFTDVGLFYRNRHRIPGAPKRYLTDQPALIYSEFNQIEVLTADKWGLLLEAYTRREFSFGYDILRGFSGILNQLFGPLTTFGLPHADFDKAILWRADGFARDRRPSERGHQFPTWSWTSAYGRISCDSSGFGVAFWAIVADNVTIMVPQLDIQSDILRFWGWNERRKCALAWSLGCIAGAPQFSDTPLPTADVLKKSYSKWTDYERYWHDAFAACVASPPFSRDDRVVAAREPGRLLCYTQEARFQLQLFVQRYSVPLDLAWDDLIIRSRNGNFAGLIRLNHEQAKRMLSSGSGLARFIAISMDGISSAGVDAFQALAVENCRSNHSFCPELKSSMPGGTSFCTACGDEVKGTTSANAYMENESRVFSAPYFLGTEHSIQSPILMNVMLVESSSPDNDQIVQRVGIGKIFLKPWAEAERTTRTLILE